MNSRTENSDELTVYRRRREVLAAMGLRALRARRPLPGAAATYVPPRSDAPALAPADFAAQAIPREDPVPAPRAMEIPRGSELPPAPSAEPLEPPQPKRSSLPALRCRVLIITAADTVWLEPIAPGASPDLRWKALFDNLLRATAVAEAGSEPEFFDWPLHDNPELDRSAPAASAALAALLARRHEKNPVRHVVLLGAAEHPWLTETVPDSASCLATVSLHAALEDGRLKARLRRDLAVLFR